MIKKAIHYLLHITSATIFMTITTPIYAATADCEFDNCSFNIQLNNNSGIVINFAASTRCGIGATIENGPQNHTVNNGKSFTDKIVAFMPNPTHAYCDIRYSLTDQIGGKLGSFVVRIHKLSKLSVISKPTVKGNIVDDGKTTIGFTLINPKEKE